MSSSTQLKTEKITDHVSLVHNPKGAGHFLVDGNNVYFGVITDDKCASVEALATGEHPVCNQYIIPTHKGILIRPSVYTDGGVAYFVSDEAILAAAKSLTAPPPAPPAPPTPEWTRLGCAQIKIGSVYYFITGPESNIYTDLDGRKPMILSGGEILRLAEFVRKHPVS